MDPRQLYTLNEAVVAKLKDHRPVLIHQLDGFVDAGQAGRLFSANLLENLEHEVLAEFDHDQLHDYRSRRPAMIFDTNQWKSYADLHLRIYRVIDGHGEVFLLFSGPEPDVQWERLAAAVVGLIEQFGVRMTVGIHGIPMAVPHTRPITLTAHATDASLINDVALTKDGAWFTDSFQAQLYFVPVSRAGVPGLRFRTLALSGPAATLIGNGAVNLNGIQATANGKTLIVAHSANGQLDTVDPITGASATIAGISVPTVDGIVLEGRRLWAVQNSNQVTRIRLRRHLTSGVVEKVITSDLFQTPSTAARFGRRLAVVNAKFDTGIPPTADQYEIVLVKA